MFNIFASLRAIRSLSLKNLKFTKGLSIPFKSIFQMSPHFGVAILFVATSKASLIVIPMTTAAIHYLYKFNHLRQMTLYYDIQKLTKNENFIETFEKVREVLLTDPRLSLYI